MSESWFTINSETAKYMLQIEGDVEETEEIKAYLINFAMLNNRLDYMFDERKVIHNYIEDKTYTVFSILANKT